MHIQVNKPFEWSAPLPNFQRIQQDFPRPVVKDIQSEVTQAIDGIPDAASLIRGKRIAITAGSRGICQIVDILAAVVKRIRDYEGQPVIIPSMGSHGGSTAEGQVEVLADLGITENSVGAPILSSMEVVEIGKLSNDMPVYVDKIASQADGILVLNRVKPHSDFTGEFESGLAKMLALGLGKQLGASTIHRYGVAGLQEYMPQAARLMTHKLPVIFGLAMVENAYHEVAGIYAVPAGGIAGPEEQKLLELAYELMPEFPFHEIEVLIVEEIGKNISGVGMDPKVIGRVKVHGVTHNVCCQIRTIVALDLTNETHGNASGIGLADIVTSRLLKKVDFEKLYINCITAGICGIQRSFVPMVAPDDRSAILTALRVCGNAHPMQARIVRIKNTLSLDVIDISESLVGKWISGRKVQPIGDAFSLRFDHQGKIEPFPALL